MKQRILFFVIAILISSLVKANHITGGQIFYTHISQSGTNHTYDVTLWLYRDRFSTGAQLDVNAAIAIYENGTGTMVWSSTVGRSDILNLELTSPGPCISNPPQVFYEVGRYNFQVTLPENQFGYTVAYQRCCRITGINNISGSSSSVGVTYTAEIPGTAILATAPVNSSAHFIGPDTVIVCQNNFFTYGFNAIDADGDSLAYTFCDAYQGGATNNPAPNPPSGPPYNFIPYASPFSGFQPMGSNVTINPQTGIVSGIAPAAGIYVVTACVSEYRQGKLIATQRKDVQIKVGDCSIAAANLPPQTVNCDSLNTTFSNSGDQSLIHSYYWTFGDPATGPLDTSYLQNPVHIYSDTGTYLTTLITNLGDACSDTGYSIVKIYPGFFPGFYSAGICVNKPIHFFDTTKSTYGIVNSWKWDFGDPLSNMDTSSQKNPTYTYSQPGTYIVKLNVTCSKGCNEIVTDTVYIIDKPPITLAFKDTLICAGDAISLQASGTGAFLWTPNSNISNVNIPNPVVNPPATTTYHVQLNESGCINNDSVKVRVVSFVTLNALSDSTICRGDSILLRATGDGLHFAWSPAANFVDPNLQNAVAITQAPLQTYTVTATIGHCSANDQVTITTVPYPVADAGAPQTICYNTAAQLHATIVGSSFSWSPSGSLSNAASLSPVATPSHTTNYVLTVYDVLGCPKPTRDTVTITVRPKINAFAGNDTAVVIGQPLQLHASGGVVYNWSPPIALSNTSIANPIAVYDDSRDSVRYKVIVGDEVNCVDSAYVTVKVFKTKPSIFVPTAFTPNNDGLNDVLRPIPVGIKQIKYFRIYNRWGQLVFSTQKIGEGWDGKINGRMQSTNSYVWIVEAVDYLDNKFFQKGTLTLIR